MVTLKLMVISLKFTLKLMVTLMMQQQMETPLVLRKIRPILLNYPSPKHLSPMPMQMRE